MLDGRTMIEQLSELERRSDPVAIELAGVWTSSYAVVRTIFLEILSSVCVIHAATVLDDDLFCSRKQSNSLLWLFSRFVALAGIAAASCC